MTKLLLAALLLPALTVAHEYGPDPRLTGAPGDISMNPMSCASAMCHTNGRNGGPVLSNSPTAGVVATFSSGSSYTPGGPPITITVSVIDPNNKHYGFEMSARLESDLANDQAGDFTVGSPDQLVICDDGSVKIKKCSASSPVQFIEHAYPKNSQVSTTPYTFTWTPPATNAGPIHFYVAGNAVNGDLQATGADHVYNTSYILTPVLCSNATPSVAAVVSASDFGQLPSFTSGSWLEIYGSNFASNNWQWDTIDFNNGQAPTSVAGVNVSINNKPAYVWFVSQGQINALAPGDSATGPVKVTVTSCSDTSPDFTAQKKAAAAGLLAPASFKVNGKQYLEALFQDGAAVGNANLVSGRTFRPAKPGDVLVFYGVGFGDVKAADGSSIPPGTVPTGLNSLVNPVKISFGSTAVAADKLVYAGLTPGLVGLYQFTLFVPDVPDGDVQINVTQNGVPLAQQLFLTIHH